MELVPLGLNGLNASPILTESGRNPRRFEIDSAWFAGGNLVAVAPVDVSGVSSAIPCKSVVLISAFVIPSNAPSFFRVGGVSARLQGVTSLWYRGVDTLALPGESNNVGDVLCAVKEILLTMFLMTRGEDQPRSSLLRLDAENCDEVGVTGSGENGLRQLSGK